MRAVEATLLSFLQKSTQFMIPICQRTYSWTDGAAGLLSQIISGRQA